MAAATSGRHNIQDRIFRRFTFVFMMYRWSKGGTVACSIENGRMLASFSSGSVACILDKAGSGSVMDTRGRCLLLISDKGIAKVLSKNGNIVVEYNRDDIMNTAAPSSPVKHGIDDSNNCEAGSPIKKAEELNAEMTSPIQEQTQKLHRWKSDGMQIDFIPKYWEVLHLLTCCCRVFSGSYLEMHVSVKSEGCQ
jgi:hypothetical protein